MKGLINVGRIVLLIGLLCSCVDAKANVFKNISWSFGENSLWKDAYEANAVDESAAEAKTSNFDSSITDKKKCVGRCTFSGVSRITFKVTNKYVSDGTICDNAYIYIPKNTDTQILNEYGNLISSSNYVKLSNESYTFYNFDPGTHYVEFYIYSSTSYSQISTIYISSVSEVGYPVTNSEGVDIYYSFLGDQAKVVSADMDAKRVAIPTTVTYQGNTYNVNYIGDYAFKNNKVLQSVHIPSSMQSIGKKAFYGCTNLKKVIIEPNTVPAGLAEAFGDVSDRRVYVGGQYIDYAFDRMVYVGNHNYDDYATNLGGSLNIYEYLSSMFTTEGITYVPDPSTGSVDAIDCDYTTQNITIPTAVSYKTVSLPVNAIKKNTFSNFTGLKQLTIGGGVKAIEDPVFGGCTSLSTVTFDSGTTTLTMEGRSDGTPQFMDCPLTTLNINRDIRYGVSPYKNNINLITLNYGGAAKGIEALYEGCTGLKTLTVTGDVEYIADKTFNSLNLTDVTLSGNKLSIGKAAFMDCKQLAGLILEPGVGNIGDQAFRGCNKIRSNIRIAAQNDLTIGAEAFYDCSAITNINLEQGVTAIGSRAFYNCNLVPTFNLSEKITSIGSGAFANCTSLTRMTIPSKVTQICDSTFMGCSKLIGVTIPATVTAIGASAFEGTEALSGVMLPESLTTIGASAFKNSGITASNIPDGVTVIPNNCFEGTKSLQTVELNNVVKIGDAAFKESNINQLSIHSCVTSIGEGAFMGCSSLETLNIENATRMLTLGKNKEGEGIFHDCALTNTYIGRPLSHGSVSDEGFSPFYGNTTMQNVTLDGNYTAVPERMFGGCTNLNTVTIGNGLLAFNQYSFANSGLKSINIPAKVTYIPAHCFENTTRLESILIPETVKRIDPYAFYGSGLKSANISGQIPTITERSFGNTFAMESLTLNEGTTEIGQYAFEGSMLPAIAIPRTVTKIDNGAFNGCSALKDFIINDGVSALELGYNAQNKGLFYDCSLENVYIGRNLRYSTSSAYGYSPFYRNTSLQTVEIGDIPEEVYIYMFQDCSSLETVSIGDGVARISDYAFSGCANLAEFNVGASIKTIGDEAFSDCGKMTSLKTYAVVPPTCGSSALSDINILTCSLYIPYGSVDAYKAADQWKAFFNVIEFDAGLTVSYIELSQSTGTMKVGETIKLDASVYPEDAIIKILEWSSSNQEVATVDGTGLVTALRDGIADITATATDGTGVKAVCRLTVIDEATPGSYRFEIPNMEFVVDAETLLPVTMVNEGKVIGFQCDLVLPSGFSVAKDSKGRIQTVKSERFDDHTISVSEVDGVVRFVSVSNNNYEYSGSDGVLFSIPIIATGDPRQASIVIRNIEISKTGSVSEEITPVSATATVVPAYILGDANGDGKISVTDVTITISAVLGDYLTSFKKAAADIDGNGKITVTDVTAIISLVLNQSGVSGNGSHAPAMREALDILRFGNADIMGDRVNVELCLDGANEYIGTQIEVLIPEGLSLNSVSLSEENCDSHKVAYTVVDNMLRMIVVSMTNENLSADHLLNLDFSVVDSNAEGMALDFGRSTVVSLSGDGMSETPITGQGIDLTEISGLSPLAAESLTIKVEGRNVTVISSKETTVSVTDLLGRIQVVTINEGTNRFTLQSPGLYVINGKKYFVK